MANYVLGPRAARWLQTQMNGRMTGGRSPGGRPCSVDEQSFCHPFELRWAASAGGDSGGAPKGAWIIWLPRGSLVVDGSEVDFSTLTAANGYPDGWYDLTDIFGETEAPEEFDLYLQPGAKAEFGIDKSKLTDPVLVASVKGKMVKGVVESALVFSAGAPHPWELRRFVKEPETSGGDPVVEWRVWIPEVALILTWGSVAKYWETVDGVDCPIEATLASGTWGSEFYKGGVDAERTAAAVDSGLRGKWATVDMDLSKGGAVYVSVKASAPKEIAFAVVELLSVAPYRDGTVNHPASLTDKGVLLRVADVSGDGVITQYITSAIPVSAFFDDQKSKKIKGDKGIEVIETADFVVIRYAGGGGGGSSGGGDGSDVDINVGVTSVNGMDGGITLLGGKGIEVTSRGGGYIMISYNADKEEEDKIPGDQCAHPGDDVGGGNAPGGGVPGGSGGGGGGAGGVAGGGGAYGWDYGGGCAGC